ncbi:MAG: hypothetical protein ACRC0G_15170, partial [Fusobacteriaceae bacterium]
MSSQKFKNITKIIKEINVTTDNRYNLDGLNVSQCRFLYRTPKKTFKDLNPGDYRIEEVGGSTFLVVTSEPIKQTLESVQVVSLLNFEASTYETEYDVDINTLKNKYNKLVENSQELWDHVRKSGFVSDDASMQLILPQLDNEQLWYYAEGEYRALDLADFRELGEGLIEAYVEYEKSLIEILLRNARENIIQTKNNSIIELQGLLDSLNLNIDNFTGDKKKELQKIIDDFRAYLSKVEVGNASTLAGHSIDKFQFKRDELL